MGLEDTLHEMLEPYIPECRYLKEVELDFPKALGRFKIPKPFYCIKTGHFNAVEAIICYNQLGYVWIAEWFNQGLINHVDRISLENYKKLQATDSYIAKIEQLKFKKPIDPKDFYGVVDIKRTRKMGDSVFISTDFEFGDENGGKATGDILIAIVLQEDSLKEKPELSHAIA